MKKRFMFILIVICLVTLLVGCGDKSSSKSSAISNLIKHETSKDTIKFNDMEWLITANDAEKKINKLIDSVDNRAKYDEEVKRHFPLSKLPEGIKKHRYVIQYDNWSMPIGKLEGWNMVSLSYDTIKIESVDNNEYVFDYCIGLIGNEANTNIFNDLSSKLQSKYGKPYESGDSYGLPYEIYKDSNGNTVSITKQSDTNDYVELVYSCGDVEDYIISLGSNE